MSTPHIQVVPDPALVAKAAADRVVESAISAIRERGRFSIALAGGSTPKVLYGLLAGPPYVSQVEWKKVHIFFGDERCVPPDHQDSNFRMANEALLSEAPIPEENIHRMRGEIDPNEAAKEYGLLLKQLFGEEGLDVALLGMGDDGHTASLFPHSDALKEKEHRVVAHYVEKSTTGKSWRITMTAPFINRCREVLVMVTGASKAQRLAEVLEGERDPERLPIQMIDPTPGKLIYLIDAGAAGMR
jgi:6-phosphogluconolactonase